MAEARLAVAFQVQVTDEGEFKVHLDRRILHDVYRSIKRVIKRKIFKSRNAAIQSVFPATGISWSFFFVVFGAMQILGETSDTESVIQEKIPQFGRLDPVTRTILVTLVSTTLLWLVWSFFLRNFLKLLLTYQGWMWSPHGKLSIGVKAWMMTCKIIMGKRPKLMSLQNCMPSLPVPSVADTMKRYLLTVRPFVNDEEYTRLQNLAEEFKNGLGKRLQRYLWVKSWWSSNYVSDWWEQYVYLRGRSPLMINSNYYCLDAIQFTPTHVRSARLANIITSLMKFKNDVDRQTLAPRFAMGTAPLCCEQYPRTFSTTRLPQLVQDTIEHYTDAKHVALYSQGKWYVLNVISGGRQLTPIELQKQIIWIEEASKTDVASPGEEDLSAMTSGERSKWASFRETFFSKGTNRHSLHLIEQSLFVAILDDSEPGYDKENPDMLDDYAKGMLCGDHIWYDKSFNVVVFKNGKIGMNAEHSWADATIISHLAEECFNWDIELGYDANGNCRGQPRDDTILSPPRRLRWDIPAEAVDQVEVARGVADDMKADLDLHIMKHDNYGKGFIKTCKISPDAYIQIALQLAHYKNQDKFCLTYESSMTRLFRSGRTETVRSCTSEACAFARAVIEKEPKDECKALLKTAVNRHTDLFRESMSGKGVDRHMFCLYIVSKFLGEESPFLQEVLSEPWRLSTSQTPYGQGTHTDLRKFPDRISAGGGFGPVADDGYGVSYIIAGEDNIFFHVSSKKACPNTNSRKFAADIEEAMQDIKNLFH
ncbi:carnitine O-palmitoyltransferase 1, liver isoform-like isoform X4 [Bolinopsis microptera]|uniref:carnitine O-palmitoyltransferase 1, liver isoform-like isoform X4 n=1 Tax=Bolinopsis microptera TaxID=2820187 RepID=UPI003079C5E8